LGNHAARNLDRTQTFYHHSNSLIPNREYDLSIPIPKYIFNEDYPVNSKTFGQKLRKARMDAGMQIKDLAAIIGVTEDTVINWEIRNMKPLKKKINKRVSAFLNGK